MPRPQEDIERVTKSMLFSCLVFMWTVYQQLKTMNMNYLIEQCIFPIIDTNECVGQGFIADGFFITAAHVISRFPKCFVDIEGKRILLSNITPLYIGKGDIENDSKLEDIAIYSLSNKCSILHLSCRNIKECSDLRSYCIFPRHDSSTNQYINELSVQPVTLHGLEEGNYIYGNCNRHTGSSGSPLINGTEVVGIMHGGDKQGLCAFLKPVSFIMPEFVPYESRLIKELAKLGSHREEPLTPEYFNRNAKDQINDAFE